jgi:multicomponent Na+:H+ antiporter subunit A
LALTQTDLKRILAYSTVSSLGMLTFLLGLGGPLAVQAAMGLLLAHAFYKGALFFVAGAIDHQTGTRQLDQLGGLGRPMPFMALAAVVAVTSMAGLPPLFGFIAKELFYEATLHAPAAAWATAAAVAANVLVVAAAGLVGVRPFFGQTRGPTREVHEAAPGLLLGPLVLGGLNIACGLWPGWIAEPLVSAASAAVLAQPTSLHLALWHGLTPALALSAVTLAGGLAAYAARGKLLRAARGWESLARFGPAGWYDAGLNGLNWLAVGQTRLLQTGYLRYYLMIVVAAMAGLTGYALVGRGTLAVAFDFSDLRFYEAGLAALILLAAVAAVMLEARLAAIAALGVVGYSISLLYVLFGAPDLAMTQLLVETLTVILFVLVFYHLPASRIVSDRVARWRDAILAAAAGAVMTGLVLVGTPENYQPISEYFEEHSVTRGHGRNVVNVILVDFRALDTLGEITVLSIAAVGVYALLKLRMKADSASDERHAPSELDALREWPAGKARTDEDAFAASFILRSTTRLMLPLLLLFAVFLLVRGHNDPGGGFSAGLVAAAAFVLYRFAFGAQATKSVLPISPLARIGAGILVAASSGILALLANRPLLTALWGEVNVPGFGPLAVGTPLLFDVGVFVAVVGVTLSIILPLADE